MNISILFFYLYIKYLTGRKIHYFSQQTFNFRKFLLERERRLGRELGWHCEDCERPPG